MENNNHYKHGVFHLGPLDGQIIAMENDVDQYMCFLPRPVEFYQRIAPLPIPEPDELTYVESKWEKGVFHLSDELADLYNYSYDVMLDIKQHREKVLRQVVGQLLKHEPSAEDLKELQLIYVSREQEPLRIVEHVFFHQINLGTLVMNFDIPKPGIRFIPHKDFQ